MTAETPGDREQDPETRKARLRAAMRTARVELGAAERAAASAEVCGLLQGMDELQGDGPYLLYAAFGDELSVDALIDALLRRGARVCLPRVDGADLLPCLIGGLGGLAGGWRGVREPAADAPEIPVESLRAVVVPGLAFDEAGNRLGYGGGHFDRLLARLPGDVPVIGVAFDVQVLDGLPAQAHDRPVHAVVTESRIVRVR
ncbi:MAG TPA: 5-formyltetrahydrofolate cyclo-ligase [Egibacteraceae bacterium]|nr:5-formyltetrahydrofolate cyclo-ligase [Egibacteraceae bacterium]